MNEKSITELEKTYGSYEGIGNKRKDRKFVLVLALLIGIFIIGNVAFLLVYNSPAGTKVFSDISNTKYAKGILALNDEPLGEFEGE